MHPVGIVIGKCTIGEHFTIYQNCSIGTKTFGDEVKGLSPIIGNNVRMYAGSMVFGDSSICDDVVIGANSVVIKSIAESGTYVGSPAKKIGGGK